MIIRIVIFISIVGNPHHQYLHHHHHLHYHHHFHHHQNHYPIITILISLSCRGWGLTDKTPPWRPKPHLQHLCDAPPRDLRRKHFSIPFPKSLRRAIAFGSVLSAPLSGDDGRWMMLGRDRAQRLSLWRPRGSRGGGEETRGSGKDNKLINNSLFKAKR